MKLEEVRPARNGKANRPLPPSERQHWRPMIVDVHITDVPFEGFAAGVDLEVPVHDPLYPLEGLEMLFNA